MLGLVNTASHLADNPIVRELVATEGLALMHARPGTEGRLSAYAGSESALARQLGQLSAQPRLAQLDGQLRADLVAAVAADAI